MPYIRREASKRFAHVFGFDLHAGDVPDKVLMTERWFLTNRIESESLNKISKEGSYADDDAKRGQLFAVLGLIMLGDKSGRSHDDMVSELKSLDMTEKQAVALLSALTGEGWILKTGQKSSNGQTSYAYTIGSKTQVDLGRRAVLQFLMSATGTILDAEDEVKLLNLPPGVCVKRVLTQE
jgi:hypothetical protein